MDTNVLQSLIRGQVRSYWRHVRRKEKGIRRPGNRGEPGVMADTTDRELLITIIKDLAEVKTEMRGYRQLEKDVRDLQKKIYQMTGVSGVVGGVIVAVAQVIVSVSK